MINVLITGPTGNVGLEVIKALQINLCPFNIYAGSRNMENDKNILSAFNVNVIKFDFTDISTYLQAFKNCDLIFLLRPPQITEVKKYFKPLIEIAKQSGVKHIVFLSVQEVENSSIIPHHKIEKLIVESGIRYTFLRPAYFMQNFTSTLRNDLIENGRIFLPAGKTKFTLVDVTDIGKVAAKVITESINYQNKAFDLTCSKKHSFQEMADQLSSGLGKTIVYQSPNLIKFFIQKRKEHMSVMFILIMIMLHYLPRFKKEPVITDWIEKITGCHPKSFKEFIQQNKELML